MAKKGKAVKQVATAAQLLERAEDLVDQCQPELAIKFFQKAAELEPNNSEIFDAIGELATEIRDPETAMQAFQRSIEIAPKHNPGKWLYIAQLVQGGDSEKYALQGIAIMCELLATIPAHLDESKLLKKQICDAYCSLGELYMTDLCDLDEAENKCEQYLLEALKYDLGLPEATQAMANFRLVQQRKEEALTYLEETVKRLNHCDENTMPSLEFRTFTGKMLVEVEKYEQAAYILEGVMQEDDENAELWFLVGSCYNAMEDYDTALEFLERCEAMLTKLQTEMGDDFDLDQQMDTVRSLIESIKQIEPVEQIEEDENHDMEYSFFNWVELVALLDMVRPKDWPIDAVPFLVQNELCTIIVPPNGEDLDMIEYNEPPPAILLLIERIANPEHPVHNHWGLFAGEDIPPNTLVCNYIGRVHEQSEYPDSDYAVTYYGSYALDATFAGNEARFINDYRNIGPRPNVAFDTYKDRNGMIQVGVWSLNVTIHAGEEILGNYGRAFWRARGVRGVIGPDWDESWD